MTMPHASDDELVLHYYGEAGNRRAARIDEHLESCASCAATYRDIVQTLTLVGATEPPARDERYGLEVWQRIRHELPPQEPWWQIWRLELLIASCAAAVVAVALAVGRGGMPTPTADLARTGASARSGSTLDLDAAGERVRLAAIGDHLDESERLLLGLVNADGPVLDVSAEQAAAARLVDASRLYREEAVRAGDALVASVLDDLERQLLDIVHGPSSLSGGELERLRARVERAALLFRIGVLADEVRREPRAATAGTTT
jgi:anti-sigma factor RsiW